MGGSIIGWMVAGLIAGGLARRVTGAERRGCLATIVIGILGGLIGGALFNAAGGEGLTGDFSIWSLFVAFIGACALLFLMQVFGGGRRRR
jgi:uncharacterized membrane protein YeaQ/YmgE (transglycosylase-associated protein family)